MLKKAKHNYGAYAPNLPGCIATGKTLKKVKKNMPEAIEMHIKGLIEDNISILLLMQNQSIWLLQFNI